MGNGVEILRPAAGRAFTAALLDFDGTLSLIRQGWQEVMAALEMEILAPLVYGLGETGLRALVAEDIDELTGRQTIFQMARLTERVRQFGGRAAAPLEYKREYTRRLLGKIAGRRRALAEGASPPEAMLLRGARAFLEELRRRGLRLYLTSGTDEPYVVEEARLLGIAGFFDGGIHGARDEEAADAKAAVIDRLLADRSLAGAGLLGIGDGFVEIVETKRVGGYAVGVASDEVAGGGQVDAHKRARLLAAGADMIVPDFADLAGLTAALFG